MPIKVVGLLKSPKPMISPDSMREVDYEQAEWQLFFMLRYEDSLLAEMTSLNESPIFILVSLY